MHKEINETKWKSNMKIKKWTEDAYIYIYMYVCMCVCIYVCACIVSIYTHTTKQKRKALSRIYVCVYVLLQFF